MKTKTNPKHKDEFKAEFEFIDSLVKFFNAQFADRSLKEFLENGMKALDHFPMCQAYALFLFNVEAFEFDLYLERSVSSKPYSMHEVFDRLAENGVVGQTLKTGTVSYHSDEELGDVSYILPLINTEGVAGLIIIVSRFQANRFDVPFINILRMYCSLMASKIENFNLRDRIRSNQEAVDQFVAMKTMELTISKNKLGDKIEKLITNLSMSIPHEFRTPINQIIGSIHFLESYFKSMYEDTEEDVYELINDIKASAARLKEGFENYIYLANLSVQMENLEGLQNTQNLYTEYGENAIYEYVNYKAQAFGRLEDITTNLVTATIAVGEEHLIKIINELIGNALKYSDKGTEISVSSYVSGDFYVITFHDRGIGFKEEQIELIEAFMQFDRNVYEQQGMGLGLSIVRKIIDIYKGEFLIDSVPGEYTKVIVRLPLKA